MDSVQRYRQYAINWLKAAQGIADHSIRQSLIDMAQVWKTLAERIKESRSRTRNRLPHVWMAPNLQEFFREERGRLQSCVRPFGAAFA